MFDAQEKSFEYATAASKLLITLATGIIAFTVTFAKEFGERPSSWAEGALLFLAWVVLLVSALFGVATLLAITGEMEPPNKVEGYQPSIRAPKVKRNFQFQIATFIGGLALIILYGAIKTISGADARPPEPPPCCMPSPVPTATAAATPSPVPTATVASTPSPTVTPSLTATPTPIVSPTPRRCRKRSRSIRALQGGSFRPLSAGTDEGSTADGQAIHYPPFSVHFSPFTIHMQRRPHG